jgi:hypothetical protein
LIAQASQEAERADLQRLSRLASQYASQAIYEAANTRVVAALGRAQAMPTDSSLIALRREIERQIDDDETVLLLLLNQE